MTSAIEHHEGRVSSSDGLKLFYCRYLPAQPKAVLLFVHGLGEHAGRYTTVMKHFAALGFGCYALDYRAHGKSPGLRVHINGFDEFVSDLGTAHGMVHRSHTDLPIFIVGHSQGGLIALHYAASQPPEGLDGAIVTSPFLGIHPSSRPPAALKAAARVLSKIAPTLRLDNGVDPEYVSRDPEVVATYKADPLVSSMVSTRWFTSILDAQEQTLDLAPAIQVPTLVMQSGSDRLVDPAATRLWVERAPKERVELVEWPTLYHEMLNEPEKEQVFERMAVWLDAQLARVS